MAAAAPQRRSILPPGERERRLPSADRRRTDRRALVLGSPYGVERRTGDDDRQADRRGSSKRQAGIGLMRDYFSQPDERAMPDSAHVPASDLIRFHD